MDISKSVPDSQEYKILSNYLSSHPTTSSSSAAETFSSRTQNLISSTPNNLDAIESSLGSAWNALILTAATQSPDTTKNHDLLVELLLALRKQDANLQFEDQDLWHDLPFFGRHVRESMNFDEGKAEEDEGLKARWVGMNALLARLTAASLSSTGASTAKEGKDDALDFSLYAIWALRTACEDADRPSDVAVRAAAVWMLIAAGPLWKLCQQEKTFRGKSARAGTKFRGKEWSGFSKERWMIWQEELHHIREPKEYVDAAVDSMKRAAADI